MLGWRYSLANYRKLREIHIQIKSILEQTSHRLKRPNQW